ncbi:MAG: hypothetical protein WCE90_00905 [Candidatus Zixiibacteriota bacterium]
MDEEEIAEKIRYILEPVGQKPPLFYRAKETSGASGRVLEFSNEQVELLLALESKIDSQPNKDSFWQLLGQNFIWPVPSILKNILLSVPKRKALLLARQHCDITAMVYIKSARTDKVLDGLLERIKDYGSINEATNKIVSCLHTVAFYEHYLFSDDQLKKIELIVNKLQDCINNASSLEKKQQEQGLDLSKFLGLPVGQTMPPLPSNSDIRTSKNIIELVNSVLVKIRFERTKQELRGVSSEINQDKEHLIKRYGDLGLDKKLIEAIEGIDIEIEETGSKFEFSKRIGFVRNIYEESLRQFAIKIRNATGVAIPKWTDNKGKMGEAIDYFKHVKFISDKEEKLLTGFSGVISDTGSHSLTSERYEVRIAKNILVEICSYLVDKIDNYLKASPKGKP